VLAHEIGHHVLAPANLANHARMLARMRKALPTLEQHAPLIANLFTDLLINDRLQRSAGLRIADVYKKLQEGTPSGSVWHLYMRIYELLWGLERGTLSGPAHGTDQFEGDARLGARVVRHFARNWLDASGRFASLLLPYIVEDAKNAKLPDNWHDTRHAGKGGEPAGLSDIDPQEEAGAIHPAFDDELNDDAGAGDNTTVGGAAKGDPSKAQPHGSGKGQARQPFEYGEILRAAGLAIDDHEAAVKYYKEQASRYLIPFPSKRAPQSQDPLPEGLEPWDFGHPMDAVDWMQSVLVSPRIVPGMTTVQRVWGVTEGREPERVPLDLDLYVDSSGSMPNPQRMISYLTLAGAIIAMSAMRVGARVQATLWSGKNQFMMTDGFTRDLHAVLRILTGFYGGATQFPIHVLRDTYAARKPDARPTHILVISDDGVSTMFDKDERGADGFAIARESLARAGGGGTLVLNLWGELDELATKNFMGAKQIMRARDEQGWHVHRVSSWEALTAFAREFSRMKYEGDAGQANARRRRA